MEALLNMMTGARCGAWREKAWGEERSRCRPGRRVARSCGRAGILPTEGRLVRSPKRFEPPNSLEIGIERECKNTVNLSVSENRTHEPQRVTGPGWRTRRWTVCDQGACRPADSVPERSITGQLWGTPFARRIMTSNTREGFGGSL